jgi:hypothetical protein
MHLPPALGHSGSLATLWTQSPRRCEAKSRRDPRIRESIWQVVVVNKRSQDDQPDRAIATTRVAMLIASLSAERISGRAGVSRRGIRVEREHVALARVEFAVERRTVKRLDGGGTSALDDA